MGCWFPGLCWGYSRSLWSLLAAAQHDANFGLSCYFDGTNPFFRPQKSQYIIQSEATFGVKTNHFAKDTLNEHFTNSDWQIAMTIVFIKQ